MTVERFMWSPTDLLVRTDDVEAGELELGDHWEAFDANRSTAPKAAHGPAEDAARHVVSAKEGRAWGQTNRGAQMTDPAGIKTYAESLLAKYGSPAPIDVHVSQFSDPGGGRAYGAASGINAAGEVRLDVPAKGVDQQTVVHEVAHVVDGQRTGIWGHGDTFQSTYQKMLQGELPDFAARYANAKVEAGELELGDRWASFDADRAANPRVYWARYDAGNPDRWKQYAAMAAAHPAEFAKLAEFQKARDTAAAKIAANPAPSEQDKQRNRDAAEKAAPAQADIRGKSSDRDARAANLLKEFGDGKTCPCVYCGRTLTKDTLSQDKLYTFNEGGRYKLANLVPCDLGCNKSRGDSKLTSKVFAADMTLPSPGTVVTAVPFGLHEAMREKSQPLPDPEIPTMQGAPATVKGPLFAMHISDPAAGIEYVKCVVGGWDVDPTTIDAHGVDLSEPWDAFAESRSIALASHDETTHWQDVDDNRVAANTAQAAREAKMPGNLNRIVPKGTLLYTTTNGPGKVSPSDRGHSGPGLYVSEDPTRQAAAGQGERQLVLQTTRSLRLLNRDNPTGETRYKEMGPYDYSANQEPDAFRSGMKKGGWDGITYTPPGASKPDVTLLDPQHTTTEIQRPRI